jgi:hypothetical protein
MANKAPQSVPKIKIHNQFFQSGSSIDPKLATPNSFFNSQNLDFRTVPSLMQIEPASRQLATNLTDLITAMEQDVSGVRYGVGSNGGLYKISTSNVVTRFATLDSNGAAGITYNQVTDQLYIPSQQTVSLYGRTGTNPTFRSAQFGISADVQSGVVNLYNNSDGLFDGSARNNAGSVGAYTGITLSSQVTTFAAATCPVPDALAENTTDLCFFNPSIEPFHSIDVNINTVGTGNWTLTLHDSLNNQLATVTITNGNLTPGYNKFTFSSQIRALVNATQTGNSASYHFHLTSTVGDGSVNCINAGDMTSTDFLLYAYRLVATNNGWHPTALFTGGSYPYLCIGNGNYLATYNFGNDSNPSNSQFVRHRLSFAPGYEVCGLSTNNQYLVIGVEKRSTNANRNFQRGQLVFWDGSTNSPNSIIDLPMGAPYGLYTNNGVTYFLCAGCLYAWSGGQTVLKVRKLAYENTDYLNAIDSTIVNPNMLTARYSLLLAGYPSSTTNTSIPYGVYSWGSVELTFPNAFGYSYSQSHGNIFNTASLGLQIGCVQNFIDSMYTSWQYTDANSVVHYGLDIVDNFSGPAQFANWSSLIWDGGAVYKSKKLLRVKLKFLPLPAGWTLTCFYTLDRSTTVTSVTAVTNDTSILLDASQARFHEVQWGFNATNTGATVPIQFVGVTVEIDPLEGEADLRKDSGLYT